MANDDFETKLKDAFSKGASASKKAFQKAGDAVQKFSDKSVIKIERQQLVNKRAKLYKELGEQFSEIMAIKGVDITKLSESFEKTPVLKDKITGLKSTQKEILSLTKEIADHDKALKDKK